MQSLNLPNWIHSAPLIIVLSLGKKCEMKPSLISVYRANLRPSPLLRSAISLSVVVIPRSFHAQLASSVGVCVGAENYLVTQ